jgi:hypothetical protein
MNYYLNTLRPYLESLFKPCVEILQVAAKRTGMSYEEINIWIFVVIEPAVFILMCLWIIYLISRLRALKHLTHA